MKKIGYFIEIGRLPTWLLYKWKKYMPKDGLYPHKSEAPVEREDVDQKISQNLLRTRLKIKSDDIYKT